MPNRPMDEGLAERRMRTIASLYRHEQRVGGLHRFGRAIRADVLLVALEAHNQEHLLAVADEDLRGEVQDYANADRRHRDVFVVLQSDCGVRKPMINLLRQHWPGTIYFCLINGNDRQQPIIVRAAHNGGDIVPEPEGLDTTRWHGLDKWIERHCRRFFNVVSESNAWFGFLSTGNCSFLESASDESNAGECGVSQA